MNIYVLAMLVLVDLLFIYSNNNFPTELSHKIRTRPEKRIGGGGYGSLKNLNKDDKKKRKFQQVNGNNLQNKKFTR